MTPQYRACLVDDELAQLTLWEPVDAIGRVGWTEVFVKRPVRVTRFLVHEPLLNVIAICKLSVPIELYAGSSAELVIRPMT